MDVIKAYGLRQFNRGEAQGKAEERKELLSKLAAYLKSKSHNQLTNEQAMKEAKEMLEDPITEN